MWITICREMGILWNVYDYSGDEPLPDAVSNKPDDLDQPPPGSVGCVNTALLAQVARKIKCPPLINAAEVAHDPDSFEREVQPGQHHHTEVRKSDFTRPCFLQCIMAILCWTVN